jgi:hypothetical protein
MTAGAVTRLRVDAGIHLVSKVGAVGTSTSVRSSPDASSVRVVSTNSSRAVPSVRIDARIELIGHAGAVGASAGSGSSGVVRITRISVDARV